MDDVWSTVLRDRGLEHLHSQVLGFAVLDSMPDDLAGVDIGDLVPPNTRPLYGEYRSVISQLHT